MMQRSPLLGRRVHIAGSAVDDLAVAAAVDVDAARDLVAELVKQLIMRGANFVVPVDAEPKRKTDGRPICFDWLVWSAIKNNIALRPGDVPGPLAVAVQHHKTEDQIPPEHVDLWDEMRNSTVVQIESAAMWNMNSKRMEAQARFGDILLPIGGTEGVLFLANLYHDAGKHVVPLNLPLCPANTGARRLFEFGLASHQTRRLFQVTAGEEAHDRINRIRFPARQAMHERVAALIGLMEVLERPRAFAVRLLNPKHPDFLSVENFFLTVVKPVVEDELGYCLTVVDGLQPYELARIDAEIFAKLHRSSVVFADLTGSRPNCLLELGYALGRALTTMVMARDGSELPFDLKTFGGHLWSPDLEIEARRDAFRQHWRSIRRRPPLVDAEPLIA